MLRSPLYEVVPLELVVGTCWVLDLNTYCKGRPVGANEHSVYVCEYRVDKTARWVLGADRPLARERRQNGRLAPTRL